MGKSGLFVCILAIVALAALFAWPDHSSAQQCPYDAFASGVSDSAFAFGAGTATIAFVSTGSNCAGVPSGAATSCQQQFFGASVSFRAIWPSTAARTGDLTGGCFFTCPGGNCRVGNNGLPVELMEFTVE